MQVYAFDRDTQLDEAADFLDAPKFVLDQENGFDLKQAHSQIIVT